MTPRQRILTAIAHKEPDRVPVDLGSTASSGISAIAYSNLKKHLSIHTGHTRIYDVVQQLAQPEDDILDRFGIDVVDIGRMFNTADEDWYDITMPNGHTAQYPAWFTPVRCDDGAWEVFTEDGTKIARMPPTGTFFDQTCFPYLDGFPDDYNSLSQDMDKVLWSAMTRSPWDNASMPDFWQQLRQRTLKLREQSDRALMVACGCNLFEGGSILRRMDNFLMDLCTAPREVEKLLNALVERNMEMLEKVCKAVGDLADIICFGDDLGMDTGPFMPPQMYRKFFKPHHAAYCAYVKKNSNMHTFLHSCGSIYKILGEIIDAGFEIINPVQTNCADMDPQRLKKEFGRDVTFWGGGCDTTNILNNASPAEVKDHVKKRIEIFAPGGGFVFNTVHNILPDVPPANIVAMFDALRQP